MFLAQRDIKKLEEDISRSEHSFLVANPDMGRSSLSDAINKRINPVIRSINKKMKKKIAFLKVQSVQAPQLKLRSKRKKNKRSPEQRKSMNSRYKENRKKHKAELLARKVAEIVEKKLVINLSSVQVPEQCYLYLAKGLNFVESNKADREDLLFDCQNFIRKLEWKAYFKQRPWIDSDSREEDIHGHMRVSGTSHPDYSHPLLDQLKTRLLGWVANTQLSTPESNLGKHEIRGRKRLLQLLKEERVFVTKADKGGATLILDYDVVVNTIEKEISDTRKYTKLDSTIEDYMENTRTEIVKEVLAQEHIGHITSKDKTIITGLNTDNNMKHSPDYRPVPPKIWPLFKVHKLSEEQIRNKVVPPQRFINAAKHGPLYRLGQWSSPHLTKISKDYCGDEFLLDTPHLMGKIEQYNSSPQRGNTLLATLDVEALYPSINPRLALEAMADAFESDRNTSERIKDALLNFTKLSFNHSCVTFRDNVYKSEKGIPTGGCDSRQIADLFLHWLMHKKLRNDLPWDSLIELFLRYIDDCFIIWKGTARQFDSFVQKLNQLAAEYGIRFGSWELGKEVNFLDITLYLDTTNRIQHKLYTKPTDARNFLRTDSFHPKHVFSSVAFSQMIRIANRNSREDTRQADLQQLKSDLRRSGHSSAKLNALEPKVLEKLFNPPSNSEGSVHVPQKTSTVFSVQHFSEMPQLKSVLKELEPDIEALLGPTQITVASKKGCSIGNRVLRNSAICRTPAENNSEWTQKCKAPRCRTCRHMCRAGEEFVVNGQKLVVPIRYNCKSKNVIYVAQCKLCNLIKEEGYEIVVEDTYFGQTMQNFHKRVNGHRACFKVEERNKSALSIHAYEHHSDSFTIDNYKFAILKECNPRGLNREEFRYIEKYRTNCLGLNRCKVER